MKRRKRGLLWRTQLTNKQTCTETCREENCVVLLRPAAAVRCVETAEGFLWILWKMRRQLTPTVTNCGDSAVKSETCYWELYWNNRWLIDFPQCHAILYNVAVTVLIFSHRSDWTSHPGDNTPNRKLSTVCFFHQLHTLNETAMNTFTLGLNTSTIN